MEESINVFYSYARADEYLQDQLEEHLAPLQQQGLITIWHDRKIDVGADWARETHFHFENAHIILLLVSPSFLSSNYTEMMRAIERGESGPTRIMPIILRPVDWKNTPLGKLQPLPTDGRPVTVWDNRNKAFTDVAQGIRRAVDEIRSQNGSTHQSMEADEASKRMGQLFSTRINQAAPREQELTRRPTPRLFRRPMLLSIVGLFILVLLILGLLFTEARVLFPPLNSGIRAYHPLNSKDRNEMIGLSDGTFAFDTQRPGGALVNQGAERLSTGDTTGAYDKWHQAFDSDPRDAEALIYLEDLKVLASGDPYITLVIGTILNGSGAAIGVGRDDLQGAYIAQANANNQSSLGSHMQVRLLIANTGSSTDNANVVARQIVQAARIDKTIVGVMGWPYSSRTLAVISTLAHANLPMVSQTASSDDLTGYSYFFRVCATDSQQGSSGANYAFDTLKSRRVALFVGKDYHHHDNPYTTSLASAFSKQYKSKGGQIVATESYTADNTTDDADPNLPADLVDALKSRPDLIYFAGYSSDVSSILPHLPTQGPFANIQVMGGDGLYELNGYSNAKVPTPRLHFTAFASPDEWSYLRHPNPPFFSEYANQFSNNQHQSYGYNIANDDNILSFDATNTLLSTSHDLISRGKTTFTGSDLRQALSQIDMAHSIQGVSGAIAFGPDGNSVNKAVVVLSTDSEGHILLEKVNGSFFL